MQHTSNNKYRKYRYLVRMAKKCVQNLAIVRKIFDKGCSRYLKSWVDWVLIGLEAFLAQGMETVHSMWI